MAIWTEFADCFEVKIRCERLGNAQEVPPTRINHRFWEPPSRRGSRGYKLLAVVFGKNTGFWIRPSSGGRSADRIYPSDKLGTKLPEVDFWLDDDGMYIFACYRNTRKTYPASYYIQQVQGGRGIRGGTGMDSKIMLQSRGHAHE